MNPVSRPNSWVSQDAAATTQFTYGLQLNPAPLTVSIAGSDPVLGSLEFVITNPTASAIALNSVAFTIQVGTDSSDLTTSTATVSTSVNDTTNWQIQSPGTVTSGPAVYTLSPQSGSFVSVAAGASIVVQIYNFSTVENPGNTTITVKETAGAISFTSFQVTTFPSGFYFNGLTATVQKGSQYIPVAQVANPANVILIWNSSVVDLDSIAIYYSNAAQGQQQVTPSNTGISPAFAVTSDTVFTVVVTVDVDGGASLTAALSTSVSVQNPALIAASIAAATATVNGPLTVTGATQANAITATGVTVNGNVSASGTLTAASESLIGALTADNATLASSLRINGPGASGITLSLGGSGVFNVDAPDITGGRFTVQNNGNVGINQPNPAAALDINGDLITRGKGGRTHISTLNSGNNWVDSTVFSRNNYQYYELIFNGITPVTSQDRSFGAQFFSIGGPWQIGNSYSYCAYGNDSGGNAAESGGGINYLRLWPSNRSGPQSPGVFGQMRLFLSGYSAYHNTQLNAPNAWTSIGCQAWITGGFNPTNTSQPCGGICFQFFSAQPSSGISGGSVDIYGWN
jgi:hypothetical protein